VEPQIVSFTKYVPYQGIPHAGGAYVLQHYAALRPLAAVHAIAPSTRENRAAAITSRGEAFGTGLVRGRGLLAGGRFKLIGDIGSVLRGSSIPGNIVREIRTDERWLEAIRGADLVELQWSEMAALAPVIRREAPATPIVLVAHDVITDRWRRAAEERANPFLKLAYRCAAALSARRERTSFSLVDAVVVFSEKDADSARSLFAETPIRVIHPALEPLENDGGSSVDTSDRDIRTVLFTGALSRADNSEGVLWFLRHVWPRVRQELPDARFVIAGAGAPERLAAAARHADGVELTGYVESFDPYYARASIVVVPIFTGAGVKFKTIEAMLKGVPVIATEVGAAGIGTTDLYVGVTSDPERFSSLLVAALQSPPTELAATTEAWARSRYGEGQFRQSLESLYSQLIDRKRHPERS